MQVRAALALTSAALALAAVAAGVQLVRAGLVTDFVGVDPEYILNGVSNLACAVPGGSDRQINVSWTDGDDSEAGFVIVRQGPLVNGTSTAVFQVQAAAASGTTVTFSDTRVVPDAQYTYTVRSFLGPAQSQADSVSSGCTTQNTPPQPTNIEATGGPNTTMVITWSDASTNEDGFYVYRERQDHTDYDRIAVLPIGSATFTDGMVDPLVPHTEYCYVVVAYNSSGPYGLPPYPPPYPSPACGTTWTVQPTVTGFGIDTPIGPVPSFAWVFNDADPIGPAPAQTKVQMQVCAADFNEAGGDGSDACPAGEWRWDSGELPWTESSLTYLQNYPDLSGLPQHPLDFGDYRYYVRLRAWDDSGTPSEWVSVPTGWFTVAPPTGASVETFSSADGITIGAGAEYSEGNGGEVSFTSVAGTAQGSINLTGVISASLVASALPANGFNWELKRSSDSAWVPAESASWETPANTLQWRVSKQPGSASGVIGGFAISANSNHTPQVIGCSATRPIGGVGETFGFTANVFDEDSTYGFLRVRFQWDGPSSPWTSWLSFGPSGLGTVFEHVWATEGDKTPLVQVKDQYDATSSPTPCDTVFVGNATPAWLKTQNADVFSGGTIAGRTPASQYNATYLVQANGTIQAFTTEGLNCQGGPDACPSLSSNYRPLIPLPQANNSGQPLATIFGSVDLGRVDPPLGILGGRRYGAVDTYSGDTTDLTASGGFLDRSPRLASGAKVLNGAIAHVLHNAVISSPVVLGNAEAAGQSGAGLVIVEGDLFINAPVTYSREPVLDSLRRLASIGWLVKGNVYIDSSLWAADPANPSQPCPVAAPLTLAQLSNSCVPAVVGTFYLYDRGTGGDHGIFFSGTSDSGVDMPLVLGGLVVAQRFALQRNRADDAVPTELFQYDGRVFANPPPGLKDFATALPRWRPLAPLP